MGVKCNLCLNQSRALYGLVNLNRVFLFYFYYSVFTELLHQTEFICSHRERCSRTTGVKKSVRTIPVAEIRLDSRSRGLASFFVAQEQRLWLISKQSLDADSGQAWKLQANEHSHFTVKSFINMCGG